MLFAFKVLSIACSDVLCSYEFQYEFSYEATNFILEQWRNKYNKFQGYQGNIIINVIAGYLNGSSGIVIDAHASA